MDQDRRIRFLVAPLLFLASLGSGMWLDPYWHDSLLSLLNVGTSEKSVGEAITILAGGGIIVFSVGVIIGTFSYVILRGVSFVIRRLFSSYDGVNTHEMGVNDDALSKVWKILNAPGAPNRSQDFFAVVSFDHGILQQYNLGVHNWLVRRWNAFSIAVTCVTALVLSFVFGKIVHVYFTTAWCLSVIILLTSFSLSAIFAWRDTMGMLTFQASLPVEELKRGSEVSAPDPDPNGAGGDDNPAENAA